MTFTFLATVGDSDTPVCVEASIGAEPTGAEVAIESVTDEDGGAVRVSAQEEDDLRERAMREWRDLR